MEKSNVISFAPSFTDQSYGSLNHLYSEPQKTLGYELKLTGMALGLLVTPISAGNYFAGSEVENSKRNQMVFVEGSPCSIQRIIVGTNLFNVPIFSTLTWWREQEIYGQLLESFYENFKNGKQDIGDYMPLFKYLAGQLSQLTIKEVFVDVSRKKKLIDFNLNLEKGIFLSVAKRIDDTTDDVMFTIALNHQTLVIDEMPISGLMPKIYEIMKELKAL